MYGSHYSPLHAKMKSKYPDRYMNAWWKLVFKCEPKKSATPAQTVKKWFPDARRKTSRRSFVCTTSHVSREYVQRICDFLHGAADIYVRQHRLVENIILVSLTVEIQFVIVMTDRSSCDSSKTNILREIEFVCTFWGYTLGRADGLFLLTRVFRGSAVVHLFKKRRLHRDFVLQKCRL